MTHDEFHRAVSRIDSQEIQARVLRRSLDYAKEFDRMKPKKNYKRIAIAAVAAVMALSVTAFAAVRSQVAVIWSDAANTIADLAEAQQIWQDTGSKLALPEKFSDGYTFAGANATHQMMAEEQGETPENGQVLENEDGTVFTFVGEQAESGVSCVYRKDGEEVTLDANKFYDGLIYDENVAECDVVELEGQTFYCSEGDTVAATMVTAEDGAVVESSVEPQSGTYRSVSWEMDGVSYSLSQLDGSLTQEELCQMALELCGKK